MELLHGGFEQFFGGGFDLAELAHFGWPHFGITSSFGAFETLQLDFASGLDALTNGCRGLNLSFIGQLLIIYAGNLDVDVNAVEQGTTDALLVAYDGGG